METRSTPLDLTPDERALLAEVLEQDYRDLRQQIGSTEDSRFREELKAREEMLRSLLDKVSPGGAG